MKSLFLLFSLSGLLTINGLPTSPCVLGPKLPIISLDYSTYKGNRLDAGVDEYLGMRFAAPPVGDLRFRAPQDPVDTDGIQDATTIPPICVGVGQTLMPNQTEDCLFVNVYTPSNATRKSNLKVWVYISGGGYAALSNANYNGTEVVVHSGYEVILVTFNYRVGAFGFLASEKVRQNGDLNAGLLDQRKLLQWVQKYISQFGGDPNHVVIHGPSAGAGSVSHHLVAYGGRDDHLFVGAIPESPFWPTQRTVPEMEFQFDRFVDETGCSGQQDSLSCLRSRDVATLQAANQLRPFPGTSGLPLWYFLPVIDGDLIPDSMYRLFAQGRFVHVPLLVGDDTNEGSVFANNASSSAEFLAFMKDNYPGLTDTQLQQISQTYPLMGPLPEHAAWFPSSSAAYGEATFTCPGNQLAESLSGVLPQSSWNYRFNMDDPTLEAKGMGTVHTEETPAIFGPGNTGRGAAASFYKTNAPIVPVVMDYVVSFVKTLNPNTFRAPDAPVWETFGKGQRLMFKTNATMMESLPEDQVQRCDMWSGFASPMELR